MRKRLLALVLMLIAVINTFAYDFESKGIYYNILSEEEHTCEVTKRYYSSETKYSGDVVIPSVAQHKTYNKDDEYTVVSIGKWAFYGCGSLTSVSIPSSVTAIGSGAFEKCDGLKSVTIPSSVTVIGERSFYGCSNLSSIAIPSSVTAIGKSAFCGCSSLSSIAIPSSVTVIGESAFCQCN